MDWAEGYVTDVPYISSYFRETSPTYLAHLCLVRGRQAPALDRAFTYCELGCGTGVGSALVAAAHPQGRFWAFDFNPACIAGAQRLAGEAGLTNIEFSEESFQELAAGARPDLPPFDFIVLHGVFSWVSAENRAHLVHFLGRMLKPGGVAYVSYNSLPGWAAKAPLQHLLREHQRCHPGRSDRQGAAGMAFLARLQNAGALYFDSSPLIGPFVEHHRQQDPAYIAHEFLNADWHALHHADVVRELQPAKLDYVGSASLYDNIDAVSVLEEVRPLLADATDTVMAETIRDFARNQQFRRDVFMKGPLLLTPQARSAAIDGTAYLPLVPASWMDPVFETPLGRAVGDAALYRPFYAAVAGGDRTVADLRGTAMRAVAEEALVEATQLSMAEGLIHPRAAAADHAAARRFNRAVAERVVLGATFKSLAAPAAGTGIGAELHALLAYPILQDRPDIGPDALAAAMAPGLARRGCCGGPGRVCDDLAQRAADIIAGTLPLWRRLGVI